ncbi:MAG: hypothetical protein ACXAC8_09760 [Candidatus Hodarchaeales archaeon]|jgi:DNA-binding transcriptional ArsR family regulator
MFNLNANASAISIPNRISPSAKAIYSFLHSKEKPVAVKVIIEELPYSERTIQYGLRQLRKHEMVYKTSNLRDLRESLYYLNPTFMSYHGVFR